MNNSVSTSNTIWKVCSEFRKVYKVQYTKSNEIKKGVLNNILSTKFPNYWGFEPEFRNKVEILCNSNRFVTDCREQGLEPANIAQHVVLEGAKPYSHVRDYGLRGISFTSPIQDFKEPLI